MSNQRDGRGVLPRWSELSDWVRSIIIGVGACAILPFFMMVKAMFETPSTSVLYAMMLTLVIGALTILLILFLAGRYGHPRDDG